MPTGASEADRKYYRYIVYCHGCDQVLGGFQRREELAAWPTHHEVCGHLLEFHTEAPA